MTVQEFKELYIQGQRYFSDLDLENETGFSNSSFRDVIFENSFLGTDFSNSDLTNCKFISCNTKMIDMRGANLTNAVMNKCSVECAMFQGAIVDNFVFTENYYYGLTLGQDDFKKLLEK
jgi:uncharacterized protein YjbI with pentapeptide repeats